MHLNTAELSQDNYTAKNYALAAEVSHIGNMVVVMQVSYTGM
jgi:hypothetical protein